MILTHYGIFAGIGGFELAAEAAGFETIGMCEKDDYCRGRLQARFPGIPIKEDVHDIAAADAGGRPVCLVTGGVPCQPASIAGKRRGKSDDRWLWPATLKAISALRPTWVVLENPLGIDSLDEYSGVFEMGGEAAQEIPEEYQSALDGICAEIEALGYEVQPVAFPAAAVAAPHLRMRIFILAHTKRSPSELRHHVDLQRRSPGEAKQAGLGGDAADSPGERRGEGRPQAMLRRRVTNSCGNGGEPGSVADAHGAGLKEQRRSEPARPAYATAECFVRGVKPGVGQCDDGISPILDGGRLNANAKEIDTGEALPALPSEALPEGNQRSPGGFGSFQQEEVLRSGMHGHGVCQRCAIELGIIETSREIPWSLLRSVWGYEDGSSASRRRQSQEQLTGEYPELMRQLSRYPSPPCPSCWACGSWEDGIPRVVSTKIPNREDRLKALGNALVPWQVLPLLAAIAATERSKC